MRLRSGIINGTLDVMAEGTEKPKSDTCVGLFGTCENDPWREQFMEHYKKNGIEYFNPDVGDDWHPGMVDDENKHLNEDTIILFPILDSSLGTGSLGEIGFSVLNVARNIQNGKPQSLVVFIEDTCENKKFTDAERTNSKNTRALVKSKLARIAHSSVFMVDSLDEMKALADELIALHEQMDSIHTKYGDKSA